MKSYSLPISFFQENRKKLGKMLVENSLAIFHSNDEMYRSRDQFFPFRQDSDLFYLSGINQERTILIIAPDYPDPSLQEVLLIRKSDPKLETWEGHKLTPEEARSLSGIQTIRYEEDYESVLAQLMLHSDNIYLNPIELPKFIPELPGRNLRYANQLRQKFPAHLYKRLAPLMSRLRTVKSPEEIKIMKKACHITKDAFLRVLKYVKPGMMEYEIEAEMTYEFLKQGAGGHAYPPIVASGINACTLHYIDNNKTCKDGDLLLMDFGAEYGNYAADCSRTIPVNGRFTSRQKDLYNSVLEVFRFAKEQIKPGNTINKINKEVCRKFEAEHISLGLYTKDDLARQEKENQLCQQYYMHGTSHFLGLDVHDTGEKDIEFKPGMVLTCEPGIYIRQEQTGIRLENDILITSNGNEDLMEDIPIELNEIENLIRQP